MRIATWNVNSIKARLPNVLDWLGTAAPDVVLLQEVKCETGNFPAAAFLPLGYQSHCVGQKTYNGVAILAKGAIEDPLERLPGEAEDAQARYLEATVGGIRVASLYLPNGNPIGTEKFAYKLRWLERLRAHMRTLFEGEGPVVLGGDYNVIPEPQDAANPKAWVDDALFQPESRRAFRTLVHGGWTEAFRALHPDVEHAYTFWDYQAGAWQRDHGIRIDHFLLSPAAADRLVACSIDREPRGREKASDHTPVVVEIETHA